LTNATTRIVTDRSGKAFMSATTSHAPAVIRRSGAITNRLLGAGMPFGPNVLVTIRGRSSGQPRTTPIAVVDVDHRRFVMGAYGDVQWTKNLRAAGEAEIRHGGTTERVLARELTRAEAQDWFANTLGPYVRRQSAFFRVFAKGFFGSVAPDILGDPETAAERRPVFELTAATETARETA
jgi:deazaflavin-dependent oxidoreductase (nitroreductase family)